MNPDPRFYPHLREMSQWWHDAGGPPLACPGWAPQAYERITGLADYCSRQWPWTHYRNYRDRLATVKHALRDLPDDNRRVCLMIPVVAEWYSERDGNPGVSPGDTVWNKGMTPKGIENLMIAARKIVAPREIQFRLYGYDFPPWVRQRAEARPGAWERLHVGVSPTTDRKRWEAILEVCKGMAKACREITGV
jgi:hypothetical protein